MQEYGVHFWNSENNQHGNKTWIFATDSEMEEKIKEYMEENNYTHAEVYEIYYLDTFTK